MVLEVEHLVGGVHVVVVDAVGKGDQAGLRDAPAEAPGDHGDEGTLEGVMEVGLEGEVGDAREENFVGGVGEGSIDHVPLVVVFSLIRFNVFYQSLVLKLSDFTCLP